MANELADRANFQKASMGGFGQVVLAAAATSPVDQEFVSVYATVDSVITYTSASYPNYGDTTITAVPVSAGSYYIAHMKEINVVSGNVIANCLEPAG